MKDYLRTPRIGIAAMAGLALSLASATAQTPQDYIVDQFGDDSTLGAWSRAWGITPEFEWDPTENSGGAGNPDGALKLTIPFDLVTYQGDNQTAWQRALPDVIDFGLYTKIHFDIKVDPSSSRLSTSWGAGQYGGIDLIARTGDWSVQLGGITTSDPWLGANDYGVWLHQALTVDQTLPNHHNMATLMFHQWSGWVEAGGATGGHTNTVILWMDNLYFEFNTNTAPPPPPSLALKAATSGLQLIANQPGSQYQRQSIRTVNAGQSWVGAAQPVTYELTIKKAPLLNGFQAHIFLIPNSTGDAAPDWNRPDAMLARISDWGNGGGDLYLGFKTNEPSGNSQIFGVGHLTTLNSATILGTWKVTFSQNTNITVSAPDGSVTNVVMPPDAVPFFADPLTTYFGVQPNNLDYIGNGFVFSNVKVAGVASPVDDSFAGPDLDPDMWVIAADNATGVFIAPNDAQNWLNWTLPAVGFVPQVTGTLSANAWTDLDMTGNFKNGAVQTLLVKARDLPAGNQAYFRMIQRPFKKLLVLLPGETAAPGTATGKTGTPDAQTVGVPFDVIVRAVDDNWNLAPVAYDTINLTSTDDTATMPADAGLALGTRTFSVTFNASGSFTITATDVTDDTKTAYTTSAVTVN